MAAPVPNIVAPEAVPLLIEKPKPKISPPKKPLVEEQDKEERQTAAELREQRRAQAAAAERRRERAEAAEERREQAVAAAEKRRKAIAAQRREGHGAGQASQRAQRRGVPEGRGQAAGAPGVSRAGYASLLAAEVARHKVYPAAARAAHATGSVGVVFTVGASGRVISHSITRSSGNSALDGAVHAMMAAVRAPPPPGGIFRSSTTINFSLR